MATTIERRFHSVTLDKTRCKGCTKCLTRCPTEAIRVRGGRAHIIDERCIDCGVCIRICEYHAKIALTDPMDALRGFKYKIALPPPSLYGQFKNLKHIGLVLAAIKRIGFDDVFEVARGADIVSRAIHERLRQPDLPRPLISSACPAVVKLIQVRFPDLIPNIVDIRQPMEVAAMIARAEACKKHGFKPEEVGVFFITPCAAKMTAIRTPVGQKKSAVDGAISMLEIYGRLLARIKEIEQNPEEMQKATAYGVAWGASSGESKAVCPENSLAVDGIENVMRVLEEVENNRLSELQFFEGNACQNGCVGGPLTFENSYVAKKALRKLADSMKNQTHPTEAVDVSMLTKYNLYFDQPVSASKAMRLDDNLIEAMRKMERMNNIIDSLPGYDCGSCGSPTCRTFAEDIVQGYCGEMDCIHKLKNQLKVMAEQMVELAQTTRK